MKTIIIYAHPNTKGHCSTILQEVQENLKSQKKKYEVLDLYKMKYDPILHEKEHYTARGKSISKQNLSIQKKIKNTKDLIFIYPVWWGSMPAILKGFFDKILTPGFGYKYLEGRPTKLFMDKNAKVFITSGGPWIYYLITMFRTHGLIKRDILGFCGIKTKIYHIYNARKLDKKKKLKIQKLVHKALK